MERSILEADGSLIPSSEKQRCSECKELEDTSIIILSRIKNEQSFIKLICKSCLLCENEVQDSKQNSPNEDSTNLKCDTPQQSETIKDPSETKASSGQEIQENILCCSDQSGSIQKSDDPTSPSGVTKNIQRQYPAFVIQPHHLLIEFDKFILDLEQSIEIQRQQLVKRSSELQVFLKDALRTIFDIQADFENIQKDINIFASPAIQALQKLKQTDKQIERQNILEDIIQYVNLDEHSVIAQIQKYKFTDMLDDLQTKLEFLSDTLQPDLFKINCEIFKLKKETVDNCNKILLKLNIRQQWKRYNDISMYNENMTSGMRGVYQYKISIDGQVSQGTSTGYVYLAMTTQEDYRQYQFIGLSPLNDKNPNYFSYQNTKSRDPLAYKLATYFLNQRYKIIQLQDSISKIIQ